MKEPERIETTPEEIEGLRRRLQEKRLREEDYELLSAMTDTVEFLEHALQEKSFSIKRLRRWLFGARTESSKNIQKETGEDNGTSSDEDNTCGPAGGSTGDTKQTKKQKKKAKGHGRNGVSAYTGAERKSVSHDTLKRGDRCPGCQNGNLYCMTNPGQIVSIVGQAPVRATIYELEKLRCSKCGAVYTTAVPEEAGVEKCDPSARAMIALLKYGSGSPFYRIAQLQDGFGIPLPTSTQWDIVDEGAARAGPVYAELIRAAAQGEVIHNDDTGMKILDLMKEREMHPGKKKRTGMFTTGMVSLCGGRKIALFFTGRKHAGENMTDLLSRRAAELGPPIQMCDALSRNISKEFEVILANCLAHGRRQFIDVLSSFPRQCRHVIESLATVYKNDEITKQQNMSSLERLRFHQENSGPVMTDLKEWLEIQFDQRNVEPNSSMGKAISYMLNHWEALTLFLKKEGAPLDNNICERSLKKAILHRKNALFYKTKRGAYVGDLFMSLIHTCSLSGVNPFKYLTALQKHFTRVAKHPEKWLPWNYEESLQAISL